MDADSEASTLEGHKLRVPLLSDEDLPVPFL